MTNLRQTLLPLSCESMEAISKTRRLPHLTLDLVRYDTFQCCRSFLIIPPVPLPPRTDDPLLTSAIRSFSEHGALIPCIENHLLAIPDGIFPLRLTHSPKFNKPMPEIIGVPKVSPTATPVQDTPPPSGGRGVLDLRSGIRIHLAHDAKSQLSGCIGLFYDIETSCNLIPDCVRHETQHTFLELIKHIITHYDTKIHIHNLGLCWSHDPLLSAADDCHKRLLDYQNDFDGSITQFLESLEGLVQDSVRREGFNHSKSLAYRTVASGIRTHYISQCALLSIGHQPW